MDDVIGSGQVEADSTRLEADQKQLSLAGLEGGHPDLAIFLAGRTVQVLIGDSGAIQVTAQDREVIDELAEHQRPVATFAQLLDNLPERRQLGARNLAARHHQLRVAAGATQAHDFGQDANLLLSGRRVFRAGKFLDRRASQRFVKCALLPGKFDPVQDIGTRWQLLQHLALGAPQDKGTDQPLQQGAGGFAAVLFDLDGEAYAETGVRAEQAGVEKPEQVPEFVQAVFHRGAAGGQTEPGFQLHGGL